MGIRGKDYTCTSGLMGLTFLRGFSARLWHAIVGLRDEERCV